MKNIFLLLILILSLACKDKTELAMERGIQYYEWEMHEKAILEFKHVIHNLNNHSKTINYNQIQLLSRAHHNLAVAYAKKRWYNDATIEAAKAFNLLPTDDNKKVLELIRAKQSKDKITQPNKAPS